MAGIVTIPDNKIYEDAEDSIIDLAKLNAKLQRWQRKHDTPEKVAAAHRKVILDRVIESMAFENEPVSMARLKTLLKKKKIAGG